MSRNLILRFISGAVLFALFIMSIIFLSGLCYFFIALMGVLMLFEWGRMTQNTKYFNYGFIIIPLPIICLFLLKYNYSYKISLLYLFSVCSVDVFAMFGGKAIGGPKWVPALSPNKTWSGLLCGCSASALVCAVLGHLLKITDFPVNFLIYGFVNGIISQISDIFISYFKRKCRVKDTGNIIPGHGGVLDRGDSTIFSAPFLLLLVSFF